ncbi:HDOD domain-containing protein [Thalassotalea sp. LPB0316]|uniref:HDOD domain-containing protein n=1 Tax=Thalassotalea sp. LPB0316 TaxID=2769490 RepID=UPI00186785AC|nr:HDOD domain-containing protein [Thalassotalea sp. LPB0316]QOL26087.1 HDOD domain-containing protein [Thalassotalea sp. LPB0316]
MKIFEQNELVAPIYQRALSLCISNEFAKQSLGEHVFVEYQDSEQANRRRELLAVEAQANKNKIIEEYGKNHFKQQVMNELYSKVRDGFNDEFDNKEHLFNSTLNIQMSTADILELLSLRAASIKRITPLVTSLPWLGDDLVNLVNKPQYRKNADVKVNNPALALSYIGLDNLKLVAPTFILKHWLPPSTQPFGLMKRKLWNQSLSIGIASRVLAKTYGLDEYFAFCAGMLINIGNLAVTRCFLRTYNEIHQQELRQAYEDKDKKLHNTLVELETAPEFLLEQLSNRSFSISADMVELMNFERLRITDAIFDLAHTPKVSQMCQLAQVVLKAIGYVAFRTLAKESLIDNDESKILLTAAGLTTQDIALLRRSDIDHLKLNFN